MKTRGDAIEEYKNAFMQENRIREVSDILYDKMKWLFSDSERDLSKEMKLYCIGEEIDNILFAYLEYLEKTGGKYNGI